MVSLGSSSARTYQARDCAKYRLLIEKYAFCVRSQTGAKATQTGSKRVVEGSSCKVVSCPSGGIGRRRGLRTNLSPPGETPEVKPVKLGEGPGPQVRANAEPSPRIERSKGRCREQTAGTYGRKAMVKACSRPRTPCSQDGGESRSGKKILRRKACRFESDLGHQFKSRLPRKAAFSFRMFDEGRDHSPKMTRAHAAQAQVPLEESPSCRSRRARLSCPSCAVRSIPAHAFSAACLCWRCSRGRRWRSMHSPSRSP